MEKKTKEPLHHIAAHIQKQCACEILSIIYPVCHEVGIILTPYYLFFPDEGFSNFPVPLSDIYGTLVTKGDIYILLENGVFHHFGRKTGGHEIVFFYNDEPDFNYGVIN